LKSDGFEKSLKFTTKGTKFTKGYKIYDNLSFENFVFFVVKKKMPVSFIFSGSPIS